MLSLAHMLESTWLTNLGEFVVNLSYNNVLRWYEMTEREDMELPEKIQAGWYIFFGDKGINFNTVHDFEMAAKTLEEISAYIADDPYVKASPDEQSFSNGIDPTDWFSYKQDSEAIYASFMFDYGIDLIDEQNKLRWEKFRALFNNLSAKSPIMRIIDIRQANIADLEGQALSDMVQAQNYYALDNKSANQLDQQFGDMFNMLKLNATENK